MTTPALFTHGNERPPPDPIVLRAGPLTMLFEPREVFLRYLRVGEHEVLRGVYAALRDHNWDTIAPALSDLRLESTPDTFQLSFEVTHREREVHFVWRGEITGGAGGTVRFTMDGEAKSSFRRNRIGFCVLHPMRCAGKACELEHAGGNRETSAFPERIAPQVYVEGRPRPHQPFANLQAMSHEVTPGLSAEVHFEGDVFEMEDQRNWTDASYKTYCTPLELPFPVDVPAGTRIHQSVTLSFKGKVPTLEQDSLAKPITLSVKPTEYTPLPPLGLSVASHGEALSNQEAARLKALNLSHLRCDLPLFEAGYEQVLTRAADQAQRLGASLELALHLSDQADAELDGLLDALQRVNAKVARWLIFHRSEKSTSERWLKLAQRKLHSVDANAKVYGGSNAYFAELNRDRPPVDDLEGLCYSINPQVHTFDNASLVESLEAQGETVRSAQAFAEGRPVAVTPVTFKPRFNPNATGPEPEPEPGSLPPQVDTRQLSLFGAGWTLGSLKYLSESSASSLTYFETTGWRGVMARDAGSPLPDAFPSIAGGVFPHYFVLADVAAFAGGEVLQSRSSQPLAVDILVLQKGSKRRILIANLTASYQPLRLQHLDLSRFVRVKTLSADNVQTAMQDPESFQREAGLRQETRDGGLELSLAPYALARIDVNEEDHDG